jgi:hypothetical protein
MELVSIHVIINESAGLNGNNRWFLKKKMGHCSANQYIQTTDEDIDDPNVCTVTDVLFFCSTFLSIQHQMFCGDTNLISYIAKYSALLLCQPIDVYHIFIKPRNIIRTTTEMTESSKLSRKNSNINRLTRLYSCNGPLNDSLISH